MGLGRAEPTTTADAAERLASVAAAVTAGSLDLDTAAAAVAALPAFIFGKERERA
jgi:hypothetical protein